jgi:hypothetical protein
VPTSTGVRTNGLHILPFAVGWVLAASCLSRAISRITRDEPHVQRGRILTKVEVPVNRGRLRHGNAPGDPSTAPRCGARCSSRAGQPCRGPAMRGKRRCRRHGGRSAGPRTHAGRERSRRAHWLHGRYSAEARASRVAAAIEREAQRDADRVIAKLFPRRLTPHPGYEPMVPLPASSRVRGVLKHHSCTDRSVRT